MTRGTILIVALACCPLTSLAGIGPGTTSGNYNVTIDSLQWNLVDSTLTATLRQYGKKGQTAIIPDKVKYGGKTYQVIGIGNSYDVFNNTRGNIRKVELPQTLKIVGDNAFSHCTLLTEINLPESVDSIGKYAFYQCSSIKSITIPSKVKKLGDSSIEYCSNLEEINLPEGLTTIMTYALSNDSKLRQITLPSTINNIGNYALSSNSSLCIINALAPMAPAISQDAFNSTSNLRIVYVPEGSASSYGKAAVWKNYIIVAGNGLTLSIDLKTPGELGNEILKLTENLSDVNVLKIKGSINVDDIYNIRNRMPNLIEIDMSETDLKTLPDEMFYNRYGMRKIVLPKNLTSIGQSAFRGCSMLESIAIPNQVKAIGSNAFQNCTSLTNIQLPAGLSSLPSNCFSGAKSLRNITLPEKLTIINYEAFSNCSNLEHIDLSKNLKSIESYAFQNCTKLVDIELPNTLEAIGNAAFSSCTGLKKVTIPESVMSMTNAFYRCDNLREINCLAMLPPAVNENCPLNVSSMENRTLYVPDITVNNYKQTRGWDAFTNIKAMDYLPSQLNVDKNFTLYLPDNLPDNHKTRVTLYNQNSQIGHLTVKGDNTLSMSKFSTSYNNNTRNSYNSKTNYATLVNEAKMRADSVSIKLYVAKDNWNFISLPFDVKVSDIHVIPDTTQWIIRKYAGEARAKGEKGFFR